MAGRKKIFIESEAISKAAQVFWEKGYDGTSAKDLCKAMGLNSGSIYHTFPGGKKELYQKSIKQVGESFLKGVKIFFKNNPNKKAGIKAFFLNTVNAVAEDACDKGCFFGNAIVEMAVKDSSLLEMTSKIFQDMEKIFLKAIKEGQANGAISEDKSAKLIAAYLLNLWQGIHITRRIPSQKPKLEKIIQIGLSVLD